MIVLTAGLASLLGAAPASGAGRDAYNPGQPWQSAYPLILDVEGGGAVCRGPAHLRVDVYDPPAAGANQTVQWRVRVGGHTFRTGRVSMTNGAPAPVTSVQMTIPHARVPVHDRPLTVDARVLPGGQFGRAWVDHLGRGCHPITVAAFGDSVVWDQGLDHQMKMGYRLGQILGRQTGRSYRSLNYAISGAVLDAPGFPPGNHASGCLGYRYAQDPDNDGQMEFGEVTQQTPDVFCQIEKARAEALAGHYRIDLVVVNGCINDLDPLVGIPYGITPGSQDLVAAVKRECSGIGALPQNPAANVPYFSGAKIGYGGRGMKDLLLTIHRELPGHPKVILADFYWALSEFSGKHTLGSCDNLGLPANALPLCKSVAEGVVEPTRWDQFARYSAEAYRAAAQQANAASSNGPFAVASSGLFTKQNSGFTPNAWVWSDTTADPAYALRQYACPELSATPPQCLTATLVHPNITGARHFATTFAMLPQIRQWFRTTAPSAPTASFASSTTHGVPPFSVTFNGSASRAKTGIASYHWYFGDGFDAVTTTPRITHRYHDPGPYEPVLVITDHAGRSALAQATTITGANVPRIPAAFSAVKGTAQLDGARVAFNLAQRIPFAAIMTGPITVTSPQTGSLTAQAAALVARGPNTDTQIHSTAAGTTAAGRPFSLRWTYTATSGGWCVQLCGARAGHLTIDITGSVNAHIEGRAGPSLGPIVRDYYQILADLR